MRVGLRWALHDGLQPAGGLRGKRIAGRNEGITWEYQVDGWLSCQMFYFGSMRWSETRVFSTGVTQRYLYLVSAKTALHLLRRYGETGLTWYGQNMRLPQRLLLVSRLGRQVLSPREQL